ncbi:MAG TPA: ABC transporter ATP-binding protein, partial [Solirubrobacteraceae bacterium]|nr:ABC transporter ATP-binding protein [Solirubrobacteraceae bacterium]
MLTFEAVTFSYPDAPAPALDGVTLTVHEGEFVVLAGPSASGKSTLLRAACGLVPRFDGGTFAGRVTIAGLDTREHPVGELTTGVGVLFQDPETQTVMGTVRAELAFPLENRGWGPAAIARGVEEVALALGIEGLLDRAVPELSGGELQRVALGAALAGRPRIVLLDEPTSQLDPVAGDELVWLLRRLNEEWGTAVVLAEHRLERCLAAADRVVALDAGAVACDADPAGFLRWAAAAAPALQTPSARLAAALGIEPSPVGVKATRAALRSRGLLPEPSDPREAVSTGPPEPRIRRTWRPNRGGKAPAPALALQGVWLERRNGAAVLRGVDLAFAAGERVALMGRNGAGKSTLLRCAAGLDEPTRGRVRAAGRVALLLQHPGDYLLAERAGDEAPATLLAELGLDGL